MTKGAPEIVEGLLATVPEFYRSTYQFHMRRGKRVLAMASREISMEQSRTGHRSDLECDLVFEGFLIFDCDMKPDSQSVIRDLRMSHHNVVMITGDGSLTAIDVARRLSMFGKLTLPTSAKNTDPPKNTNPVYILMVVHEGAQDAATNGAKSPTLVWRNSELTDANTRQEGDLPYGHDFGTTMNAKVLYSATAKTLCVTGAALTALEAEGGGNDKRMWQARLQKLAPNVAIFARVSPVQKEAIIHALNAAGKYSLMVGDGTNDVGALKAAHVGVSIVNAPELERRIKNKAKALKVKSRERRLEMELSEQEMDPTLVKLGDASIASPFTSRRTSIDSVMTVLRHGRCSLVTTVEVYKILALNCLISAYMMSTLYLKGLKQGDFQMTAMGIATAMLFYFLSAAKPVSQLSIGRPPNSVFAPAVICSIVGQFCVNFACLLFITHLCETYTQVDGVDAEGLGEEDEEVRIRVMPDGRFRPSLMNTSVFLLASVMQTNSFVINYRGAPFTQDVSENVMMYRGVQAVYAALFVAASGMFEPLSDLLELAPFPDPQLRSYVFILLFANFGLCWVVEQLCRKLE